MKWEYRVAELNVKNAGEGDVTINAKEAEVLLDEPGADECELVSASSIKICTAEKRTS